MEQIPYLPTCTRTKSQNQPVMQVKIPATCVGFHTATIHAVHRFRVHALPLHMPPDDDDANLVGLLHGREAVSHDDHRHALLRHQIVDGNPKLPGLVNIQTAIENGHRNS